MFSNGPRRASRLHESPIGGLAKLFLQALGIEVLSHVVAVGAAYSEENCFMGANSRLREREEVLLNCADPDAEQQ